VKKSLRMCPLPELTPAPSNALLSIACEVMGSTPAAIAWLGSPQVGLAGLRPVDFAALHGEQEVLSLLGRIEHGVYW
jgi:uncharacterized protein (DUF2384 family)